MAVIKNPEIAKQI